ncbi:MAG: hypothetical protein ABFD97_19550 [Syntrophobacter sp.]
MGRVSKDVMRLVKDENIEKIVLSVNELQIDLDAPRDELAAFKTADHAPEPIAVRVYSTLYVLDYASYDPLKVFEFLNGASTEVWIPADEIEVFYADGKKLDDFFSKHLVNWIRIRDMKFFLNYDRKSNGSGSLSSHAASSFYTNRC